jgi:hypothetical protein
LFGKVKNEALSTDDTAVLRHISAETGLILCAKMTFKLEEDVLPVGGTVLDIHFTNKDH